MSLIFKEDHPFSAYFKFKVPVLFNGNLYYKLSDFINKDFKFEQVYMATKMKFLYNPELIRYFERFYHLMLIPEKSIHEQEQEVINSISDFFKNMEYYQGKLNNLIPIEGNYSVILKNGLDWKKIKFNSMNTLNNNYTSPVLSDNYIAKVNDRIIIVSNTGKSVLCENPEDVVGMLYYPSSE